MLSLYVQPEEKEVTENLLKQKLGEEHLATRTGAGRGGFTYVEGWKVIELANSIFGFNGWCSTVVDLTPDYIEEVRGKVCAGVTAVVKITLKDGSFHEDVGFGAAEHRVKGIAIGNAKKEAVTDARKRALRQFGNALGNCLRDKDHLKKVKPGKSAVGPVTYEGLRETSCSLNAKDPTVPKKLLEVPPLLIPVNNTFSPTNTNPVATPLLTNHDTSVNTQSNSVNPNNNNYNNATKNNVTFKPNLNRNSVYTTNLPPPSSPSPSIVVKQEKQFQHNPNQNNDNNGGNNVNNQDSYFLDQFKSEEFANDVFLLEELAKSSSFPSQSSSSISLP